MYYVENSHPAIIPPETFELVQDEFRRRKAAGKYTSAINCFASRIVCGECGGFYGRKVWHSNSKYACTVWHCNKKFRKKEFCTTPHLKEETIKEAFLGAFNSLIKNKGEMLESYDDIIAKVTNCKKQEEECTEIDEECLAIEAVIEKLISENARFSMGQDEYNRKYQSYAAKYNDLQKRLMELRSEIEMCRAKRNQIRAFISELGKQDNLITEFDEGLWCATLNTKVVKSEKEVVFHFKDGTEIIWELE